MKQYNSISRNNIYSNGVGIYIDSSIENTFAENNLIENGYNAWFWETTLISYPLYCPLCACHNIWDNNYWDDWKLPTPKPIEGMLTVWWGSLYIDLQWFMFDKHPAMQPYGNFTLKNLEQNTDVKTFLGAEMLSQSPYPSLPSTENHRELMR
jgi:parallel beta-helix repeat protein